MSKEEIIKIVDECFHFYASEFRSDAKSLASKLIDENFSDTFKENERLKAENEKLVKSNSEWVAIATDRKHDLDKLKAENKQLLTKNN